MSLAKKNINIAIIILCLIACFMGLTSCTSTNVDNTTNKTISVSGTGSVSLPTDIVSFRINVSEVADTTGEAQQATNKKMSQILSILKENGIEEENISTTALNFSTNYSWRDGEQVKIGEEVSQTVYVKLYNCDAFASLADSLGSQVSGISFYNVSFDSTQRKEAENKARELAYKDAVAKAQIYATAAGLTLGSPISIQDGYSSYAQNTIANADLLHSAKATSEAFYATETPNGPLTVTSNVDIVFALY